MKNQIASNIPLAVCRKKARQRAKPGFKKSRREYQKKWRLNNIKKARVAARRRYRLACAKNPAHRTLAQWHEENRQAWLVRGKKWTSEAARNRAYRLANAAAIRARDKMRRAREIENLASSYVRFLLTKSTGLKRISISAGMINAKRRALKKHRELPPA